MFTKIVAMQKNSMADKLGFNQRQKSQNALNEFEYSYGRKFKALIMVRTKGGNRSSVHKNQDVYILRGQYDDQNMPFVVAVEENYDSQYTVIENNGDCLTMKLADRTIDILPQDNEKSEEENDNEQDRNKEFCYLGTGTAD